MIKYNFYPLENFIDSFDDGDFGFGTYRSKNPVVEWKLGDWKLIKLENPRIDLALKELLGDIIDLDFLPEDRTTLIVSERDTYTEVKVRVKGDILPLTKIGIGINIDKKKIIEKLTRDCLRLTDDDV